MIISFTKKADRIIAVCPSIVNLIVCYVSNQFKSFNLGDTVLYTIDFLHRNFMIKDHSQFVTSYLNLWNFLLIFYLFGLYVGYRSKVSVDSKAVSYLSCDQLLKAFYQSSIKRTTFDLCKSVFWKFNKKLGCKKKIIIIIRVYFFNYLFKILMICVCFYLNRV